LAKCARKEKYLILMPQLFLLKQHFHFPFLLGSVLFGYYPKIEETEAIKTKIYLVEITKIYIYNVSKIILE
jgi:hypothetical protein